MKETNPRESKRDDSKPRKEGGEHKRRKEKRPATKIRPVKNEITGDK